MKLAAIVLVLFVGQRLLQAVDLAQILRLDRLAVLRLCLLVQRVDLRLDCFACLVAPGLPGRDGIRDALLLDAPLLLVAVFQRLRDGVAERGDLLFFALAQRLPGVVDPLVDIHDLLGRAGVLALDPLKLLDLLLRRDLAHVTPVLDARKLALIGFLLRPLRLARGFFGAAPAAAAPASAFHRLCARVKPCLTEERQQRIGRRNGRIDGAQRLRIIRRDLRRGNRKQFGPHGFQLGNHALQVGHAALHRAAKLAFQPAKPRNQAVQVAVRHAQLFAESLDLVRQVRPGAARLLHLSGQRLVLRHLCLEGRHVLQLTGEILRALCGLLFFALHIVKPVRKLIHGQRSRDRSGGCLLKRSQDLRRLALVFLVGDVAVQIGLFKRFSFSFKGFALRVVGFRQRAGLGQHGLLRRADRLRIPQKITVSFLSQRQRRCALFLRRRALVLQDSDFTQRRIQLHDGVKRLLVGAERVLLLR